MHHFIFLLWIKRTFKTTQGFANTLSNLIRPCYLNALPLLKAITKKHYFMRKEHKKSLFFFNSPVYKKVEILKLIFIF